MNTEVRFSNKTKTYVLRTILAGILSLIIVVAGAGQTLKAHAESLAQTGTGTTVQPIASPATNDTSPGTEIPDIPFSDLNVDTSDATSDTNGIADPASIIYGDCNSDKGYASVWYNFTPTVDIDVAFNTIGSNYDTVLAIWKGSLGNLTLVTCNDDLSKDGTDLTSQVGLAAKADVTYYIEIIEFAQPAQSQDTSQRILNFHAYIPPGVGAYDDTDTNWTYDGSWLAYSGSEPYANNTTHYTSSVGDKASFTFSGTQFILKYTQAPNRGNINVYVDGSQVAPINANGVLTFQKTYTSPIFPAGTHFVQFKHVAGGVGAYIDVDAIEILSTAAPGVGVYDDTHANWSYSGFWVAYSGPASYANNTTHYTAGEDNTASFTFNGTQFILTYTQALNRANIDVYVDRVRVATINANGALAWQKTYTSPVFPAGTHFVEFKHGGGGTYIDVDVIEILATAAPGAGVYDDSDANWSYTAGWLPYSGSKPFGSTLHYNNVFSGTASFTFSGMQFILTYTQALNRGDIDVFVDDTKIATVNATGALQWQKVYISPVFSTGTHFVQIRHAGGGGAYVDVDAIQILSTPAPGVGVYNDSDANWSYSSGWLNFTGSGPSGNTLHYTSTVGSTATFSFSGTQFILTYTQAPNRGNIAVYMDGNQVAVINATGALQWQKVYISPVFSTGTHFVQIRHAGGGGAYVDVDAIQILSTPVPGVGVYNDSDANWSYSSGWLNFTGSGPSGNTLHYTSTVGSTATFSFSGTQFILTYTQAPNRGNIAVYMDGNQVAVINATGILQWQKTYTSPVFAAGVHFVQFTHAGGAGAYVDVDAIQILSTPAPGVGVYDDTHANWSYSAGWSLYNGSNPLGNTLHYTSTVGSTANFTFSGTQFILTYTQATNRGNIGVFVDGIKIATINATGALQWRKTYTSPVFSAGTHVVRFKHAGSGGAFVDVDAIEAK